MDTIIITISCRYLSPKDVWKKHVQGCCSLSPVSFPNHAGYPLLTCRLAWRLAEGKASPQLDSDSWKIWIGGVGGVNWNEDDQLYLMKFMWVWHNKEEIWLTAGMCSSQSLASISSCERLSELPTSRTMLGRLELAGQTPESACFFLNPSSKAGWRQVN